LKKRVLLTPHNFKPYNRFIPRDPRDTTTS
jgi:hypothetical protein